MRLLDHPHVVGPVADGERDVAVALDERGDLRLLQRRHAAADDSLALEAALEEQGGEPRAEGVAQGLTRVVERRTWQVDPVRCMLVVRSDRGWLNRRCLYDKVLPPQPSCPRRGDPSS